MSRINALTTEQSAQIHAYLERWRGVVTKPLDRAAATTTIERLYAAMGKEKPMVLFFDSPMAMFLAYSLLGQSNILALRDSKVAPEVSGQLREQLWRQLREQLSGQLWEQLREQLSEQLWEQLSEQLSGQLWRQLREQLWEQLREQLREQLSGQLQGQLWGQLSGQLWRQLREQLQGQLWEQLREQLSEQLWEQLSEQLSGQLWEQLSGQLREQLSGQLLEQLQGQLSNSEEPEYWIAWAAWFDFARSIGVKFDDGKLGLFLDWCTNCGWVLPFDGICLMSERPTAISWNAQNRLHNPSEPAIRFADGYSLWAYDGVRLPQKYSMPANQWQSSWLLEESNAELRRVLIQGIGYERIMQELSAICLDTWIGESNSPIGDGSYHFVQNRYDLYRIEKNIDVEPIHLLKMTCPSTNHVHVGRVPPNITSAYEAASWRNWGKPPTDFTAEA